METKPSEEFEVAPLTKDHRCSACMCYMPFAHQMVIDGYMSEQEYEKRLFEQGRWEEMIIQQNRLLKKLREAKQELKRLKRQKTR